MLQKKYIYIYMYTWHHMIWKHIAASFTILFDRSCIHVNPYACLLGGLHIWLAAQPHPTQTWNCRIAKNPYTQKTRDISQNTDRIVVDISVSNHDSKTCAATYAISPNNSTLFLQGGHTATNSWPTHVWFMFRSNYWDFGLVLIVWWSLIKA